MNWEELKARALLEPMSRVLLEQRIRKTGGDGDLYLRLARVCVREDRILEAIRCYDQAELLGAQEASAERAVIARNVGDFPDRNSSLA